jgi:glycosyltransferase involved in cell wall biosynthesis
MNPEMGGAEVFTREIIKRLSIAGHEITLFTSEFKGSKKEEIIDNIRIVRDGGKFSVYQKAKNFYKKHHKENYDIVIDEVNTRPFLTPKFANNKEKIFAIIYQLAREYWFYETPFPINYIGYYFLENMWLKNYINIPTITISKSTKKDLTNLGFKKIYIISVGINLKPPETIPEKEKEPTIIYLGRLKRAKRPDHVIKAFKIIKRKIPKAKLWIIGNGYLRKDLERNASEDVKFFGYISEENKIALLSKAWIIVNPSIREGFGLNIIEANALGTPAIAYDVPGLRDSIIDGKTGLIVKENGNVEKLAEAIIRVLEDEPLRKTLSINALEYSKNFNWDRTAQEFEEILKETINVRGTTLRA